MCSSSFAYALNISILQWRTALDRDLLPSVITLNLYNEQYIHSYNVIKHVMKIVAMETIVMETVAMETIVMETVSIDTLGFCLFIVIEISVYTQTCEVHQFLCWIL